MTDIKVVINEGIKISEVVHRVIFLNFELYDRLHINGAITNNNINSNEITFTQDASNPNYITGFAVKVVNPDKKKVKKAIKIGYTTVNYLSAKTGVVVRSKRPKIEKQMGDTVLLQAKITPPPQLSHFDLDASKLSSMLSKMDHLLNKKVAKHQSGMAALEDNDVEKAVPSFHQVIEETEPKKAKYYQPLRTACSHVVLKDTKTIKKLKRRFKIRGVKQCQPVDFTDVHNWQQLYINAHKLMRVADIHIKKLLAQSNL